MVGKNADLIKKTVVAGLCIALSFVLPLLTAGIPEIGGALCPMHIPAFLAGAVLGPLWGGLVAFISPLMRGLILGSPIIFPRGICMAVELLVYAVSFALALRLFPKKLPFTYISLASAMFIGRIFGGLAKAVLFAAGLLNEFGFALFISGYFVETLPGAVLQIILIPPILHALGRSDIGLWYFPRNDK